MRTADQIHNDIVSRFELRLNDKVAAGSVLDFYNTAVSKTLEDVYQEIENNKNPHLWSKLYGQQLDDMGTMLNCPREIEENDTSYRYRLMNWVLRNEASNTTAISDALLNPTYASNIEFRPFTKGSGTATCYIIPRNYNEETVASALQEAHEKVSKVASPSLYVEYIIPTIRNVRFQIFISGTAEVDLDIIKENVTKEIREYVNAIPPQGVLEIGAVNKIGISQPNVNYFNVIELLVEDEPVGAVRLMQELDSKFIFDEIIWEEVG